MRINKYIVIAIILVLIVVFSLTAISQVTQVKNGISAEELQNCNTIFYDESTPIYSDCIYYYNYTLCLNTSGPNTDCSIQQSQTNIKCKSEITTHKNRTECIPLNKFIVSIDKGLTVDKKEIDFSRWGVCIQETENDCLAVICGTLEGGSARNGVFNGCDGGKSCQKFLFCPDGIKTFYKGSGGRFVADDPTFHLSRLEIKEVGK